MSNEFEWKTEEEAGWEEEIAVPETRPSRPFPWKLLALVLVVALVVVGGARWQLNRQVSAATANVENEVRAAHRFLHQVAGRQDEDLFRSLLSGRDMAWTEVQKTLVAEGWFGNPPLLGWTAVPPATDAGQTVTATVPLTITLSPDFFTAEVQSEQDYQLLNPQGMTETVTLRQTAVYRKGESRWLYAPPDDEFWGRMVFHSGAYISVLYPERDEAIVQQLAQDLDDLAQAVCRELATRRCLQRALVQVRFSKEPATLLSGADTGFSLHILSLPTPSLMGLPVDEAGYQALFRAYGTVVATTQITQQVSYECCRWQLLYEAMLDRQLHRLGLKAWPLDPATYDQLLAQPVPGGLSRLLVNRPDFSAVERKQIDAFVEFLEFVVSPEVTLAEMQRTLADARSMTVWVNQYVDTPFAEDTITLDQALFRYMLQQTTYAQMRQPPFPLPDARIQLLCNTATRNDASVGVYEYMLAAESWQAQFYEEGSLFWAIAQPIRSAPDLIFLVEFPDEYVDAITYSMLENGQRVASFMLEMGAGRSNYFLWSGDPHGRYLLLARWDVGDTPPDFRLLDVAACRQGACRPWPVDGPLIWSPDGRHTLAILSEEAETSTPSDPPVIWLGDATGANRQAVGVGLGPFWLDESTYGYQRLEEWVTAVIGENTPRRLFTVEDLLAVMPQAQRPQSLAIGSPIAAPGQPGQLLVRVNSHSGPGQIAYLFALTLTPDLSQVQSISQLSASGQEGWHDISPDGRWLVAYESLRFGGVAVALQNLQTGDLRALPSISSNSFNLSWSPDGRWYIRAGDGLLALGAPDANYERYIFHDYGACYEVFWK